MYQIYFTKSAEKELSSLPKNEIAKILPKIDELEFNPRPNGVKKLKGFNDLYRIRIGNYRVVYYIEDEIKIVEIIRINHRKDIY